MSTVTRAALTVWHPRAVPVARCKRFARSPYGTPRLPAVGRAAGTAPRQSSPNGRPTQSPAATPRRPGHGSLAAQPVGAAKPLREDAALRGLGGGSLPRVPRAQTPQCCAVGLGANRKVRRVVLLAAPRRGRQRRLLAYGCDPGRRAAAAPASLQGMASANGPGP